MMPNSPYLLHKFNPTVLALSLAGFFAVSAEAQTIIPSSTSSVNLQTLSSSETTFDMPSGSTITTSSGSGINGDASKNWLLSIEGSVTGAGNGVTLSSSTVNGARIDNYGLIRGNGTSAGGNNAGVYLLNGGTLYNHTGATLSSGSDAVYTNTAGASVINDGTILTNVSGVYLGAGGSFTQGATGVIDGNGTVNYGVVSNGGVFNGNNAGLIKASAGLYGVWIRNAGSGSLTNSGTISTSSGSGAGAAVYLSVNGNSTLNNTGIISGGSTTSVGVLKDNSGSATINNQSGGVISGSIGINLASGSSTVTNTGTITGTGGTAINMSSAGNSLILDTGSILNGNVISGGATNSLTFQGAGSSNSSFIGTSSSTGFNSIVMNGTNWNLSGNINLIGTNLAAMSVNTGSLVLTGNLNSVGVGGGITIASGASIQVGNGGATGDINGSIVNNGTLSFFRADSPLMLDNSISGNGIIRFKGTGVMNQSSYVMNGNNSTFTGDIVIESGARVQATSANPTPLAHILVRDGGSLWLGSHSNYTSPIFLQGKGWTESMGQLGALRLDSGAVAAGTITLLGDARITAVFANYTGTISGDINDGGHGYALEKTGDGLITLSGTNTYSGGTQINGGTLSVADDTNLGVFGSEVSFDGGRLLLTTPSVISHDFVINAGGGTLSASTAAGLFGNITGAGTLTFESGIFVHSGDATHTGGTIINSGAVLTVGVTNVAGGSIAGDILNNGTHQINLLDDYAYSGVLSGSGNLVKTNTSTATLSGVGSSQGSVNVNVGELFFAQTGTFTTTGNFTTAANATTSIAADSTLSVGGVFTQANNANLNLALGSTEPVILADSAALSGVLNITGFGANAPSTASGLTSTLFNVIHTSAANGLTGDFSAVNFGGVTPVDYLTLSGSKSVNNQDYNVGFGLTWIAGTAKGNGSFTLANAGDTFNVDVVLADQTTPFISGWNGKTLTKNGAGTLTLSSANTYTGNTVINAGTLKTGIQNAFANSSNVSVASGSTLDLNNFNQVANNLSGGGHIVLGSATLIANSSNTTTFSGNIDGSGSLIKTGNNILTLTGTNTYSGGTLISYGGSIIVTNGNALGSGTITNNYGLYLRFAADEILSNVLAGSGGEVNKTGIGIVTLTGTGSTTGNLTLNQGGVKFTQNGDFIVQGGYRAAAGTTTELSSASTLKVFEYNQAEGASLTVALGSVQPIIDASRAILGGALNISGFSASAPNSASALSSTQFNIIHTTDAGGGITGDFSSINLGGASNSLDYLQLSAGKSANSLDYNVGFGLTWLAGTAKGNGVFTLTNASDTFDVDVVLADQIAPFTSGWDGKTLTKEGAGTLTLSSANTYTGSTIINAGTLKTNAVDVFVTGGNISEISVASGATLDLNGFNQKTNNLTGAGQIKLGSAALTAINYIDSTFSGSIEGSGSLIKANSGILTLSGNNTYSGGTLISGGWISATSGSAMGTGAITNNSAMELAFANDSTLVNALTGTGLLVKNKLGTATLSSAGSSVGNIDISAGTLEFAQNGAFTVSNNYLNLDGAATSMNANSTLVVGNQFRMNGALNIIAGNTQPVISADTADLGSTSTLNISGYSAPASANASDLADNTYRVIQTSGTNYLTGDFGSVNIGGSSSPVDYLTLTGNVDLAHQNYDIGLRLTWYAAHTASPTAAHGTFTLSGATDQFNMDAVLANEVANANTGWDGRSLTKAGAGTLILSKANTYTGVTQINGGSLKMGVANAIALSSDVAVSNGSELDLDGFNQNLNNLSGAGQITLGSATLSAYNNTVGTTFSGQISGSGNLVKEGASTLILSGNNAYTGTTTINTGTLQLGDGGVSGSVLGDIVDNGVLSFNRSNDLIYSNVISGSGSVVKEGSNTLVLTNDHTYLGGTTINTGTLQIGMGGISGSITGDVLNDAALVFNRSDDIQYDYIVSGTGSLTKEGDGALTLNTAQTYTGTTNVNHGTLIVGDDTHSGAYLASTQVNIASGAIFGGYGGVAGNVNNQGTLAVADALAPFSHSAAGTFTIGGDLTNSGNIILASVVPASRLVINGNYIGNNGLITLSTALNSDSNSATDKIEILGNSSGHTNVKINNANGSGDQTIDGIEIISIAGQSNGTFSLVGRVVAGAYDYGLFKNSSDGDWYLRSFKDNGGDGPKWRPEVGAYLGNQYLASMMQIHTLYDRQSSVHSQNNGSGWVRVITRKIDSKAANGQVDQDSDYNLIQFGGDVAAIGLGQSRLHLGAMGSYGSGDTDATTDGSSYKAKGDVDGYNIGLYATWFADFANAESQKGLYVDGWVQGGWYDNKVQGEALNQEKYDSRAWAASLEAGYSFELVNNAKYALLLTPQAQVVYSNYQADDHTEQNGSRITNQDGDTLLTRLGARLSGKTTFSGHEIQPFFEMNWWHSNQNNSIAISEGMAFNSQTVEQGIPKDRAEFKAGIQGEFAKNWSGWLNVGVQTGSGDYRSVEGFAGVKYIF